MAYLLGLDIGSSSIKVAILDSESGAVLATATSPQTELPIEADFPGWAEQDPNSWWEHVQKACVFLSRTHKRELGDVSAIGISYQMHGLVLVDEARQALRPAILWCDSRAVEIGIRALEEIGAKRCFEHLLNSPGNFTASKLRWVLDNEPDIFERAHKAILPGDYIAMRLTNEICTTVSGLSEGILWDFKKDARADFLLDYYAIPHELLAGVVPTFGTQGKVTREAALALGIKQGTPVTYRAGDQSNNAFALKVLEPGEAATTAGTSGVIYGVSDHVIADRASRVNTFLHVNHAPQKPRYGSLLCCNGTGILNSWLKREIANGTPYDEINGAAQYAEAGCRGLFLLPYGNGAERSLENKDLGASLHGLNFNIHTKRHVFRAAQEGIVFSLHYGLEIMRAMGLDIRSVRAARANLFLSPLFGEVFAAVTGTSLELFQTDGAAGAARGAGLGAKIYRDTKEAFSSLHKMESIEPDPELVKVYAEVYPRWKEILTHQITR